MANLDLTKFVDAFTEGNTQLEIQTKNPMLVDCMRFSEKQTNSAEYVSNGLKEKFLTEGTGRTFYNQALKENGMTYMNAETWDIPANLNESDRTAITVYTKAVGFHHNPYQAKFNYATPEENFRNQILAAEQQLCEGYIADLLSYINTIKTQKWTASGASASAGTITFDETSDALLVSKAAALDNIFDILMTQFGVNEFGGGTKSILASTQIGHNLGYFNKLGAANSQDLQYQNNLPFDVFKTNKITTTGMWDGYMCRDGALGVINTLPNEFLDGYKIDNAEWGVVNSTTPLLGSMPIGVVKVAEKSEISNIDGQPNSVHLSGTDKYMMVIKYGFMSRYNSDRANNHSDVLNIKVSNS